MTVTKIFAWTTIKTIRRNFIEEEYRCTGDMSLYYITLAAYIVIVALCVAVVALKTKKLRLKQFRDFKKVNTFIFLYTIVGNSSLILQWLLKSRNLRLQSLVVNHAAHCLFVSSAWAFCLLRKLLHLFVMTLHKQ